MFLTEIKRGNRASAGAEAGGAARRRDFDDRDRGRDQGRGVTECQFQRYCDRPAFDR